MAKALTQSPPSTAVKNNFDNIAGASGGMILATLAQNLPESSPYKSWLIIIAPALTLVFKYIWDLCSCEVIHFIKTKRIDKARRKALRQIDLVLAEPNISEAEKQMLREQQEKAQLSVVYEMLKHLESIRKP